MENIEEKKRSTVTGDSRTTIAMTKESLAGLKAFSKDRGLKMYEVLEAFVFLLNENEEIAAAIEARTNEVANDKRGLSGDALDIRKLAPDLKKKLKSLSPDQLAALLGGV